jgi:hypothetical protein
MSVPHRIAETVKTWVRSRLRGMGIVVRRVKPSRSPPIVFDDPLEALVYRRGGKPAAFRCPLERCVAFNGFPFGAEGWHPFVAAARELGSATEPSYRGSLLERYYHAWQPTDAAEALIGCTGFDIPALAGRPSYAYLAPWLSVTSAEFMRAQEQYVEEENLAFGGIRLPISAGYTHHGPVSYEKGQIEHERLKSLYRSISSGGYDRSHGDVEATLLKRGSEHRFLINHGHHRSAVASASGVLDVPACFSQLMMVDIGEAEYWPQVRCGGWPLEAAVAYFHHLFDFDSVEWARGLGLTPRTDPASAAERSAAPGKRALPAS